MKALTSQSFGSYGQIQRTSPLIEDEEISRPVGLIGADSTEEMVKMLTQRIADISSRLVAKDELANQQARIAKEAVQDLIHKEEQLKQHAMALKAENSAREKADAGYWSMKQELEKACQQKILAEARLVQLNGAMKECMDDMRQAKEQLEFKAQEGASRKREWDNLRSDLEAENAHLKRQLMEAKAENIAISKSAQERARSLTEVNEHKGKVESESKILQVQIESLHKDMDAYKYEIHLLKKEVQIQNEDKDQNKKAADATYKQHLEDVKKIVKLDSECNRLRALIRKKLPGPAAIAQMRVEADHMGKKRLPSPKLSSVSSQEQKELEALTERLVSMEDDAKLLKEALAKRTAELQSARQLCARTASKLSSAEAILEAVARGQPLPTLSNDASAHNMKLDATQQQAVALPPPLGSPRVVGETMEVMDWAVSSEEGTNDDELSSAESWASALIAELSHIKKDDDSAMAKTEEICKPGIVNPPRDFDMQASLQELNSKLSLIGESILALPSSMKHADEQGSIGNGITGSNSVHFGILSHIMEEFTHVKQLLTEVGKAMELEKNRMQVLKIDRSMQGGETSKRDSSIVVDDYDMDAKLHVGIDGEKHTYVGAVRKITEALLVFLEIKQGDTESKQGEEQQHVVDRLQKAVGAFEGGHVLQGDGLEEAAAAILCKVGDMLNLHYAGNMADDAKPSSVEVDVEGTNSVAAGVEENDCGSIIVVSNLPGDEDSVEGYGTCNAAIVDDNYSANAAVVIIDRTSVEDAVPGRDFCIAGEADAAKLVTTNCELMHKMEILQHKVQRLSSDTADIASKLEAAEVELEQERARSASLEAESLQLGHDNASLANQLSDALSLREKLAEDLADARACMDNLRQQVATLTSELADRTARSEELKGNEMHSSDVGTPAAGRKPIDEGDPDAKATKELEIASAKAQLAECQRSILVLGSQLRAMSSAQDHVASLDSSFESATSTDQMNLAPLVEEMPGPHGSNGGVMVPARGGRQRRAQPGFVKTRGGRLVNADQIWGSAGDLPVDGSEAQGVSSNAAVCYSFGSRHLPALPRHLYSAGACPQSPIHEYVSEAAANLYSPPETALSSPAGSPARYNLQVDRSRRGPQVNSGTGHSHKALNKEANAAGCPSPSPVKKPGTPSRIARFFSRTKNHP